MHPPHAMLAACRSAYRTAYRAVRARISAFDWHHTQDSLLRVITEAKRGTILAVTAVLVLTVVAIPFAMRGTSPDGGDGLPPASDEATDASGSGEDSGEWGERVPPRASRSQLSRTRTAPPPGKLAFGAEPLRYVKEAAEAAAKRASCPVSAAQATALTLAPTWPETAPSGQAPSPMTLSRWDLQRSLGDPLRRARALWFYPGIGPWQLDSAGIGAGVTALEAMDTKVAANRMAPYIVGRYCGAIKSGASERRARARAWRDWYACDRGACERAYRRVMAGDLVPVDGIDRFGGAQPRKCEYRGKVYKCLFVDPAAAEGANWWTRRTPGAAPTPAPFYVLRVKGRDGDREVRYWLAQDSKAVVDVAVSRRLGRNARRGLSWSVEKGLCDRTTGRGDCDAKKDVKDDKGNKDDKGKGKGKP